MIGEELRERLRDIGLLVLRLGMALPLLTLHGCPKWANYSQRVAEFPDPLGVGSGAALGLVIFAEVVCAILLIAGLATRFAAAIIAGMFAIILFEIDAGKPWGEVELPLLYGLTALTLLLMGAGRLSIDAILEFLWRD